MLAITERLIADKGLEWAFCDTDSMAIAKPDAMLPDEFQSRVNQIVKWFAALNPYAFGGSILKIEDENYALDTGKAKPLYCWAVSSKRYALFNFDSDGEPIMRKVSAHGLGHLLPPYTEADAPTDLRTPHPSVLGPGIERWHVDLWTQMARTALSDNPDRTALAYHASLAKPAISRYSATTPDLLRWFKFYNKNSAYRDQVKPFGFLLAMSADKLALDDAEVIGNVSPRHRKSKSAKPIAPFDSDYANAITNAFCRETGKPVRPAQLKTYCDALARYHIQPESKFLNGDYADRGVTERRHISMTSVHHIGKESNDWERQAVLGLDHTAHPDYGLSAHDQYRIHKQLASLIANHGKAAVARALDITSGRMGKIVLGKQDDDIAKLGLACKLPLVISEFAAFDAARLSELDKLREAVAKHGLRSTARKLGLDPSNLRRRLTQKL